MLDIRSIALDLPEDILKAKWCGDFTRAQRLIRQRLENPKTPACVRERLEWERVILQRLPLDYTYSEEEGLALIRKDIPDFTEEEFHCLEDTSAIDWIYVNGKVTLATRFYKTLITAYPDIAERAGIKNERSAAATALLDENARLMKEKGSAAWHIHLKAFVKAEDEAFRPGETIRVHLPLPIDAINMKNIRILGTSPEAAVIGPADAPQRTVYFECTPKENIPFTVEYEYDSCVKYTKPDPAEVSTEQPSFDTEELLPHIQFTPFIRALCAELSGDERNPLILARRFYDYCTTVVTYSFVREYFTLTEISDYAGLGQKGDCGVQALLFITLCRCAGIPARWQSGAYMNPYAQDSHDWAQFYVAPYGWLFADPSFGGSAYRAGDTLRYEHYFGNLDPFRMAANSEYQSDLTPAKKQLRADPYDNQCGEMEYDDHGLSKEEMSSGWEIIDMHPIE